MYCFIFAVCYSTNTVFWCSNFLHETQNEQKKVNTLHVNTLHSAGTILALERRTDAKFHGLFHNSRQGECIINLNVRGTRAPSTMLHNVLAVCVRVHACVYECINVLHICECMFMHGNKPERVWPQTVWVAS